MLPAMSVDRDKIPYLPERIEGLGAVATNLSWSWSRAARQLFSMIDEPLWHLTRHNPIAVLRRVEPARLSKLAREPQFLDLYDRVMQDFRRDQSFDDTWFSTHHQSQRGKTIAYFCAEFGLHNSVPIYSGGLGVLAGDHCKSSSDLGVPLIGVGLYYKNGYFDQKLRLDGWQEDSEERFDVVNTPLERVALPGRDPWLAALPTFGRDIHLAAWRMNVGRVPVILLDSDLEQNDPADRELTSRLYTGGPDVRLRQEWILGVGGVRVLRALGYSPAAWHANEGHAAFMHVERLRELVVAGHSYEEAVAQVRASSIFTTHTPVPAGHDTFSFDQVEQCAGAMWDEMQISREQFLGIGQHPTEEHGRFHMTVCALRLSRYVNGVARRHGEVSRQIWAPLWPDRDVGRVPIGHVTNGVHKATWMSKEMMELFDHHFGHQWGSRVEDPAMWEEVLELDDHRLWSTHLALKTELLNFVREQARRRWARHWKEATHVVGAGTLLNPNALTIGFARRFATYKRADLVFSNAALHFVAGHEALWARLASFLSPSGQLAIHLPANQDHATHVTARELAAEEPFAAALGDYRLPAHLLQVEAYATLLRRLGFARQTVRLAVYGHLLESPESVVEWVKGSILTDLEARMPPALYARFLALYRERLLARLADERPYFFTFKRVLMHAAR
jgi:starch phosphorylase